MAQVEVRDIKLRNTEFLDIVNEYKDVLMDGDIHNHLKVQGEDLTGKYADAFLSDQYLQEIIKMGKAHDGFPKMLKGYRGLKHEGHGDTNGKKYKDASARCNKKLIEFFSCRNNALNAFYPPEGFISWHNNANAPGYNIICTWSETGDGWFDYWDLAKQERVRVPDVKGWQAKMTYFGPYDQPDKLCYHAAYTKCNRITVAFVFAEADNFWQEVIEDLETEC